MKNLIIDASNYPSPINGKSYVWDEYACNYPVDQNVFTGTVSVTNASKLISTTGDFYSLLGADISNTNVPLYKFLAGYTGSGTGPILEIDYILSPTTAMLKQPCPYATGTSECVAVDFYGQPTVEQTFGIDSAATFSGPATVYTKFGASNIIIGASPQLLGSDPLLVNMASDWGQFALNIQYL